MKSRRLDLQTFRAERKITQQRLAELSGYPQSFISQIERGKVSVPVSFIELLQQEYGLNDEQMEAYLTYIEVGKPIDPIKPLQPERKKSATAEVPQQEIAGKSEAQATIDRLVSLLEISERRNAKLEAKIERLENELSALKK